MYRNAGIENRDTLYDDHFVHPYRIAHKRCYGSVLCYHAVTALPYRELAEDEYVFVLAGTTEPRLPLGHCQPSLERR